MTSTYVIRARMAEPVRVSLISWSPDAEQAADRLRSLADEVEITAPDGPPELKALAEDPPDAFVIDLSRRPRQGLVIGIELRRRPGTRHTPQVFAGGDPNEVERVREILPDARYSDWDGIGTILRTAVERPPGNPVVPDTMAPYVGVPLEQKLGLAGDARARLIGAPQEFESLVEEARRTDGPADVVLLFARTNEELDEQLPGAMDAVDEGGSLWIAWPKGGSGARGDVTQLVVRERGMSAGWVDYKIASLDDTWSALKLRRRD
jgi:hypothetical protein